MGGPRLQAEEFSNNFRGDAPHTASRPGEICRTFTAMVLNTGNTSELPGEFLKSTSTKALPTRLLAQSSPK